MKKGLAALLCLLLLLSLSACGKSPEVKETERLIGEIGEVSLDSAEAIEAAEAAYAALGEDDKAKVENYALLQAAQEALLQAEEAEQEARLRALAQSYAGKWVKEYDEFGEVLLLSEDGSYREDSELFQNEGSWRLSEDGGSIIVETGWPEPDVYQIIEEDGFEKLCLGGVYVREAEVEAAREKKYVTVSLSTENMRDYFGEFVGFRKVNAWGEDTEELYFFTPSLAYQRGLVYVGCRDFALEYTCFYGYGSGLQQSVRTEEEAFGYGIGLTDADGYVYLPDHLNRAIGELTFVRGEYVSKNEYRLQDGYGQRVVTLVTGEEIWTQTLPWEETGASYEEYRY